MIRCEACRFDYYGVVRTELPDRLRAAGADHVERLSETPAAFLRERPLPGYLERELREVDWIARHTLHELLHHLADIDRLLLAALES